MKSSDPTFRSAGLFQLPEYSMSYGSLPIQTHKTTKIGAGTFGVTKIGRDPASSYPGWVIFRRSEIVRGTNGFHGGIYILAYLDMDGYLERQIVVQSENLPLDLYRIVTDSSQRTEHNFAGSPNYVRFEEIPDEALRAKRAEWWELRDSNMLQPPAVTWDDFRMEDEYY
jgi:hypothetical protein